MRSVDLAVYADAVAGEHAALAARAERARQRLAELAIERRARQELPPETIGRLDGLGLLNGRDERALQAGLRELALALEAVTRLQSWLETELATVENGGRPR